MTIRNWFFMVSIFCLSGCSGGGKGGDDPVPVPEPEPEVKQIPINLSLGIGTRATEDKFESGDRVGLFVVNYSGTTPGELTQSENHVNNLKFTYTTKWSPEREIFWKDETTRADFYGYYPYAAAPDVKAFAFEVKADQSDPANYKASDFLWGKTSNVAPTPTAVDITMQHVFSCAQIKLEPGDGFTTESLNAAAVSVKINHTKTKATVNLATGVATANGDEQTTVAWKDGEYYKAMLVPQTIPETDLIVVNVDGKDYTLNKAFTFEANKRHEFTVTVNKTSNGININIGKWDEDETDHGGVAE